MDNIQLTLKVDLGRTGAHALEYLKSISESLCKLSSPGPNDEADRLRELAARLSLIAAPETHVGETKS